eukprot:scaffold14339_cov29-Phaeocystis_antarctica.AAC.2
MPDEPAAQDGEGRSRCCGPPTGDQPCGANHHGGGGLGQPPAWCPAQFQRPMRRSRLRRRRGAPRHRGLGKLAASRAPSDRLWPWEPVPALKERGLRHRTFVRVVSEPREPTRRVG